LLFLIRLKKKKKKKKKKSSTWLDFRDEKKLVGGCVGDEWYVPFSILMGHLREGRRL